MISLFNLVWCFVIAGVATLITVLARGMVIDAYLSRHGGLLNTVNVGKRHVSNIIAALLWVVSFTVLVLLVLSVLRLSTMAFPIMNRELSSNYELGSSKILILDQREDIPKVEAGKNEAPKYLYKGNIIIKGSGSLLLQYQEHKNKEWKTVYRYPVQSPHENVPLLQPIKIRLGKDIKQVIVKNGTGYYRIRFISKNGKEKDNTKARKINVITD